MKAVFAAGCFWGVQELFDKEKGVTATRVGYTGGSVENPSYEQVCTGTTGHAEAIEIDFDEAETSYEELVRFFFEIHDFTQIDGQGPDIGDQYRSEIFYLDEGQKKIAQAVIGELEAKGHKVATRFSPASEFYPAEDYHQKYYEKSGGKPYCHVRKKVF